MDARLFCFAVDLVDDLDATLDDLSAVRAAGQPSGSAGVMLAASYHAARDVLPRNARRVHYSPAGVAFVPDLSRYPAALPPHPVLPVCAGRDVLAETVEAAHARGMRADAWVVYLHHDAPDLTATAGRVVNAFGDTYPVSLCPASPTVTDYARALTADACARRPDGIFAEALHHQPFSHGFHHERSFHPLAGLARLLLALCFCAHCTAAGKTGGLDVKGLRAWVRDVVDAPGRSGRAGGSGGSGGSTEPSSVDGLGGRAGAGTSPETLAGYLRLRAEHTVRLVRECAGVAAAAGVEFAFFDAAHALAEPLPAGPGGPGWQLGVDLPRIARGCTVASAFYLESAAALATQLAEVTAALAGPPAGAILRPMGGDLRGGADLDPAVRLLYAAGVDWIGYYHYGLAADPVVAGIRAAHSRLGTG